MQIVPLLQVPELLHTAASALFDAFGQADPSASIQRGVGRLTSRLNQDELPICLVAHESGEFLGTASVVIEELASHPHLSPWLSGVLVQPTHRRRGIGKALVASCVHFAADLGFEQMYLFTPESKAFYGRLGWQPFESVSRANSSGTIMSRSVVPNPSFQRTAFGSL
ncbi:GNAT family N-acetyltransferase [bacterium]|nr:MAG: GNAT family N-acetyltransferase [bacterium]